jgi:hypothetical protein
MIPEEQIKRTLNLVMREYDFEIHFRLEPYWYKQLAWIVHPHRLFNVGDLVFVVINNGQASRYPVKSVSSKGYTIKWFYLQYARWQYDCRYHRKKRNGRFGRTVKLERETKQYPNKMLEFIEFPPHLRKLSPDNADVQQFLLRLYAQRIP